VLLCREPLTKLGIEGKKKDQIETTRKGVVSSIDDIFLELK
jgi:hypothetical protein